MLKDYNCMREVINSFIKKIGVDIILSKAEIDGLLHVFYYNWFGTDGKYYSLLAPCSTNHCYSPNITIGTSGYSLQEALRKNLRCFESKEAWHDGMWTRKQAEDFNKALERELLNREEYSVCVGGYTVHGVQLHVQPELGISIWYKKEDLDCFTIWYATKTTLETKDPLFKAFIDSLGFKEFIEVTVKQDNTKCIGVNNYERV